jgi:uncharacterized cupin superfamily protein
MRRQILAFLAVMAVATAANAQDQSKIIRLSPDGAGQWEQGNGTTKTFYYYKSKSDPRVAAGVWASNEPGGKVRKATFTEFIHILEGSVVFEDKNGKETIFKAGDSVVIPRGTEFAWKKSNNMKEYWVIFDRQVEGVAPVQGEPMFYKLSPDGPAGKGLTADKNGRTKEHEYFSGPDGSSVGVWETKPHTSPEFYETKYAELMLFLSGNVTLSTPEGQVERFKAGEVALVPKGIRYKWSSDTVRKYWVIFDADASARTADQ